MAATTMADLRALADQEVGETVTVDVESIVPAGGPEIRVDGTRYVLDNASLDVFGNFFGVPKKFLPKLSGDLQRDVLKYFLDQYDEAEVQLEIAKGQVWAVYGENDRIIPKSLYVDMMERVLPPDAELKRVEWQRGYVWVDAVTQHYVVEPRKGDPTLGGFRCVGVVSPARKTHPGIHSASPYCATFMERLACTNGMTKTETGSVIKVRGNTVEQVIEEMEHLARRILSEDLPRRLEQWEHTAEVTVDNAEAFVHRIARETGLGAKVEDQILERLGRLGDDRNNMYDLANLMTSFQHEDGMTESQRLLLQDVGGHIIDTIGGHRCGSCQTLLK